MGNIVKYSEVAKYFRNGIALYIGEQAFSRNKRYCCGQPQLRNGNMVFTDTPEYPDGMQVDFPVMIIDCEECLSIAHKEKLI